MIQVFFMSLVVLLLVLMVLLILYWTLRHNKNRNLTVLKISAGRPTRVLTIRTEADHAQQMLDRLLDRVFLQMERGLRPEEEPGAESGEERGSDSDAGPEASTFPALPIRAIDSFHDKMSKWVTFTFRPRASPPPPPNQDQPIHPNPQESDTSHHASVSSQGASCSSCEDEQCVKK